MRPDDRPLAPKSHRGADALHRPGGLRRRGDPAHERRHLPRAHAAGAGHRHPGPGPGPQGHREDHLLAPGEVRERHPRRGPHRERVAQQFQRHLRLAQMGHGPQLRADPRAAADGLRHVGGAQIARRPAALRAPVRPVERARRPGGGDGGRIHEPAALRLRDELRRAAARGHLRGRQRRARRRAHAPDQHRRRSRQGPGAEPHRGRHLPRRRQVERAPALRRVHLAPLRRQRLHQRHPGRRGDHRQRAGEGRGTASPS